MATLKTKIKFRRGTFNELKDVVLEVGEPCYVTDTSDYIVGDGSSKVSQLIQTKNNEFSNHKHKYTPSGIISKPTFTGNKATITTNIVPKGTVTIETGTGATNYTPEGSISSPSFTGSNGVTESNNENAINVASSEHTHDIVATGNITITSVNNTSGNYTPAGTVSKPNINISASSNTTFNAVKSAGTVSDLTTSYNATSKTLTFNFSKGTATTTEQKTINTGYTAALAAAPTFTGTKVQLSASFSGTSAQTGKPSANVGVASNGHTHNFKPSGLVGAPTFTGTGVQLIGTFSGQESSNTLEYTPTGTISQPTFTGTEGTTENPQ